MHRKRSVLANGVCMVVFPSIGRGVSILRICAPDDQWNGKNKLHIPLEWVFITVDWKDDLKRSDNEYSLLISISIMDLRLFCFDFDGVTIRWRRPVICKKRWSYDVELQGFPGVHIVVGHFLDSFLWEVNIIWWKLDSMVPLLDKLLGNSYCICPTRVLESRIPITISSFHGSKSQLSGPQLWELLENSVIYGKWFNYFSSFSFFAVMKILVKKYPTRSSE